MAKGLFPRLASAYSGSGTRIHKKRNKDALPRRQETNIGMLVPEHDKRSMGEAALRAHNEKPPANTTSDNR